MAEFPRMLYRLGSEIKWDGVGYDTRIVQSQEEQDGAVGWYADPLAAKGYAELSAALADEPPTRAELETKALELGIDFDGRTRDGKLAKLIADKLEAL